MLVFILLRPSGSNAGCDKNFFYVCASGAVGRVGLRALEAGEEVETGRSGPSLRARIKLAVAQTGDPLPPFARGLRWGRPQRHFVQSRPPCTILHFISRLSTVDG
ncbi:hypothetical protein SAMN05444955_10297 [Lihuaxuella thermophila]|uniref:Uncharacterized protein n=1 Tax=Lihuaxuella thermophila TaxID=1173111 RepID=A0A1H8BB25_9BACL|nr:hypothetical protein SAMN05444955_10297 [Lihuaxuella thermophila]